MELLTHCLTPFVTYDEREWPTVPQVFVKGEFVGGCDIMMQMHESGELETMLKEAKLRE